MIPEAAAKHPEQLRLHCWVRLSIRVGGTFSPSSSSFLRCCLVSLKALYSCLADKMYLGCRIAQGRETWKKDGPNKFLRNSSVTKCNSHHLPLDVTKLYITLLMYGRAPKARIICDQFSEKSNDVPPVK